MNDLTKQEIAALRASGQHEKAFALVRDLVTANPNDASLQYEAACLNDFLGHEHDAVPYYVAALAGKLSTPDRLGAFLGLGSTFRTIGQYQRAEEILLQGLAEFPEAMELKVFLAMSQHNLGKSKTAIETLLLLLAKTSNDPAIQMYRRAIELYSQDIERIW
jgi:tetratricopeptide (TPR) repeat protein